MTKNDNSINIFSYLDYRSYLSDFLEKSAFGRQRGTRAALSKSMGCQQSYLSRVFAESAELSPEQADSASHFLGHTKEEKNFFMTLVLYSRAGTNSLRERFRADLKVMREQHLLLKNRITVKQILNFEHQVIYYSTWHYTAIHMLITIPKYQKADAIAKILKISISKTHEVLRFLTSVGLAKVQGEKHVVGETQLYLEHDSPLIQKHHTNLRVEAIKSLDRTRNQDLHYSAFISISEEDIPKVREVMVKAIETIRQIVKPSSEEKMACYCLDLFSYLED